MEHHHVSARDVLKVIRELVNEQAVLVAKFRLHRCAFNAHRLVQKGNNQERRRDRNQNVPHPETKMAPCGGFLTGFDRVWAGIYV